LSRLKHPKIIIANLIRERLRQSAATSREVWEYTHEKNAPFRVSDHKKQRKSVRKQLSRMYKDGKIKHHGKIGIAWIYAIK